MNTILEDEVFENLGKKRRQYFQVTKKKAGIDFHVFSNTLESVRKMIVPPRSFQNFSKLYHGIDIALSLWKAA